MRRSEVRFSCSIFAFQLITRIVTSPSPSCPLCLCITGVERSYIITLDTLPVNNKQVATKLLSTAYSWKMCTNPCNCVNVRTPQILISKLKGKIIATQKSAEPPSSLARSNTTTHYAPSGLQAVVSYAYKTAKLVSQAIRFSTSHHRQGLL